MSSWFRDGSKRQSYVGSNRAHDAPAQNPRLRVEGDRTAVAEQQYSAWATKYDAETASYGWCAPDMMLEWATDAVPPSGPLRVLDIGVGTGQGSAPYLDARSQVTGLDISEKMLDEARAARPGFHHLAVYDINDPLSTAGVTPASHDLVVSCGTLHFAKNLGATIKTVADAMADGANFAFTYIPRQDRAFSNKTTTHLPSSVRKMIEAAGLELVKTDIFVAYYDKGNQDDPVRYARVLAKKPGEKRAFPPELADIDRTGCVDRDRILQLFGTPLIEGPMSSATKASVHAENQAMLEAFRTQLDAGGEIDVASIPLPSVTAKVATQGAPQTDVLALLAHPDDESVYMGGTMGRFTTEGLDVTLVHSTGGEGGRGGGDLAEQRAGEQRAALKALGMSQESFVELGFEDFGKYRDNSTRADAATAADTLRIWGADELVEKLVRQIRTTRPNTIVSFDPTRDPNYSLHGHHLAMGIATMLAYHLAADPEAFPDQGLEPWAAHHHEVIVPDHATSERKTSVTIDRDKKLAALLAHASQRYSTERLIGRLEEGDERQNTETWHRFQSRRPDESSVVGRLEADT